MVGEWISITERLPDYDERVLVVFPETYSHSMEDVIVIVRRTHTDKEGEHWRLDDDSELTKSESVTHWTPLPIGPHISWTPLPEGSDVIENVKKELNDDS